MPAPANDAYANRETISGSSGSVSGTTVDATSGEESGTAAASAAPGGSATVWYEFTPSAAGLFTWSITALPLYHYVSIFSGTLGVGTLVQVGFDTEALPSATKTWAVPLVGGTSYKIMVSAWAGATTRASFTLSWTYTPPPANDDFANATNLTGTSGGPISLGVIEAATREASEPGDISQEHTVWWKHTATQDGLMEVLIQGVTDDDAGSTYLGAYTGSVLASLAEVAYSDYTNFDGIGSNPTDAIYNSLRFVIEAGTTYYIQAEDDVIPHTDKEILWREVVRPDRSTDALAVTGTTEMAEAMRNFTGEALPSATDANGGRWATPAGYNVNATSTVETDGLLFDGHLVSPGSGVYVQSYVFYVDPADDETLWLVSIGGDLMYECGFQMAGETTDSDQNFYFYWDEQTGSARIGWWLSQEPGNSDMLLYFLLGNFDAGGWTIVPTDWPIRVRLVYDADGSTTGYQWNGYVSVDGGATWLWQMGVDGTISGNNFRSFGPQMDGHGGDPAWSVLLEGWGGGEWDDVAAEGISFSLTEGPHVVPDWTRVDDPNA